MFQEFTGKEYLKIDIANNFGLDSESWDDRIAWFDQNEANLDNLVHQADEPALFYAAIQAWKDVMQGLPIGYMISLDATASGLQILACLSGDRKAASLCNVIDVGYRADSYTIVYTEMCDRIGDKARIERKQTKLALMTHLYTSVSIPKEVFGEGPLLTTFYSTVTDLLPGADELNKAFPFLWNPNALSHDWVLPDNFHVKIKVMDTDSDRAIFLNRQVDIITKVNRPTESGRSLGANTIHSIDGFFVREMTRRCSYDPAVIAKVDRALAGGLGDSTTREQDQLLLTLWGHYKASGFLSARILDVIDDENVGLVDRKVIFELIETLPKKPFTVLSVHDCFRCLPHYGNDLRRQYNQLLYTLAKSELLSYIVSQLLGTPTNAGKLDPMLYKDVLDTNYALS